MSGEKKDKGEPRLPKAAFVPSSGQFPSLSLAATSLADLSQNVSRREPTMPEYLLPIADRCP